LIVISGDNFDNKKRGKMRRQLGQVDFETGEILQGVYEIGTLSEELRR
jgi:hypothetical protein